MKNNMDNKPNINKKDTAKEVIEPKKSKLIVSGIVLVLVIAIAASLLIYNSYQHVAIITNGEITEKITKSEFQFFLAGVRDTMLANAQMQQGIDLDSETFWNSTIEGESAEEVAKKRALESAKENKIQLIKAREMNITLTSDEQKMLNEGIQSTVEQLGGVSNANKQLEVYGINLKQFKEIARQNEIITKLYYNFTENQLKDFYESNKTTLFNADQERVWARHILLLTVDSKTGASLSEADKEKVRARAEEVLKRAQSGEDFAKLAEEFSEDPGSNNIGGQYVFPRGVMEPAFEDAAFSLKPGEISGLVETSYGYHIIKLEKKYAAGEPVEYEVAKDNFNIRSNFFEYMVKEWSKEFTMKVNDKVYNAIKIQ